jgi:hypothetical protein
LREAKMMLEISPGGLRHIAIYEFTARDGAP